MMYDFPFKIKVQLLKITKKNLTFSMGHYGTCQLSQEDAFPNMWCDQAKSV